MMEKIEIPFRAKCDMLARVSETHRCGVPLARALTGCLSVTLQEAEAAQQNFVRQRREFEELQSAHKNLVRQRHQWRRHCDGGGGSNYSV